MIRTGFGAALLALLCGCGAMQEARRAKTLTQVQEAGFVAVPFAQVATDPRFASLIPYELTVVSVRSGEITCFYDRAGSRVFVGGPRETKALANLRTGENSDRSADDARRMVVRDRPISFP